MRQRKRRGAARHGRALLEHVLEQLHVFILYLGNFAAFDQQRPIVGEELDGTQKSKLASIKRKAAKVARHREEGLCMRETEC